jgi:hypothetical protein
MRFGGYKTENDRLKWKATRDPPTDRVVIPSMDLPFDACLVKNKFYVDPKWKVATPSKWIARQDFKSGKGATTWKTPLTVNNEKIYEPHIDGFEVTGSLSKKDRKHHEISRK